MTYALLIGLGLLFALALRPDARRRVRVPVRKQKPKKWGDR